MEGKAEAISRAIARARAAQHFLAALDDAADLIGDALQSSRLPVSAARRAEDLVYLQDIADAALTAALDEAAACSRKAVA